MPRRTKEEAEETKKSILQATLDIFCEKGYSRTTFDEIAKRINLTKGAIYWHFRNKADILSEIIRKSFSLFHDDVRAKIHIENGLSAIKDYMFYEAELIKNNQTHRQMLFFFIYQMEWSEAILNKVNKEVCEVTQFPESIIKEALVHARNNKELHDDLDIDSAATYIFFIWEGIMKNMVKPFIPIPYDKLINDGYKMITKGLKDERSE